MVDNNNFIFRKEIQKLSPYIPGKPVEEVQKELGLKKVIKMASNENPLGPSPKAIVALKKNLKNLHYYPDGSGEDLRNALAKNLALSPSNIVLGCGSDEIIHLLCLAFLNKGEEVITGHPSFVIYKNNGLLLGGKVKLIPLKNYTYDLEGIYKNITTKTKLIFIANPNNPTGTIVNQNEIKNFLDKVLIKFPNLIVVFDEAYYEYVQNKNYGNTLTYIKKNKNVVILRTFSKIFGLAGLRIGYALCSLEIASHLNRVREPFNVSSAAQIAAKAALEDKEHLNKSQQINLEGKKYLYQEFKKMNLFFVPTEANFIFVDLQKNSNLVFQQLLKKGIIIRTGDIFGLPTFARITIGTKKENEKFINGLKEIL